MSEGHIHVGIGGWTFEPWRGTFYPKGLPHARELEHAAARLTAIEINGTYHRLQKPESFAKWAASVPAGFRFTVKASRYCTNRTKLGEAGEAIERFMAQGVTELGSALGPILWQFMPTKRYDPDDFGAFLALLPRERDGITLRHAVEVRHESFRDPAFIAQARQAGAAIVFADSTKHPVFADLTSDFVYARLQDASEEEPSGYGAAALDRFATLGKQWASGKQPADLAYTEGAAPAKKAASREVFIFMINGAKVRAPAAAEALIGRLTEAKR